jgi:hypothetical protein
MTQAPVPETWHSYACGAEPEGPPPYIGRIAAPHEHEDGEYTSTYVIPMALDAPAGTGVVPAVLPTQESTRTSSTPPGASRDDAIARARTAGILGATALGEDVVGRLAVPDLAAGTSATEIHGPTFNPSVDSAGGFGVTRTSAPVGDGCTDPPCGTVGPRSDWPIAKTMNLGTGRGLAVRRHIVGPICTLPAPKAVTLTGKLGQEDVIRRYIRRQLDQLTYCYEKQLLAKPDLAGEVKLDFLIDPNGHVQALVAEGVSDEVSTCVGDVVKAIEFPKASNGGSTWVKYPVQFRISGA